MHIPTRTEPPGEKPLGALCRTGTPRFVLRHHNTACRELVDGHAIAVDTFGIHESEVATGRLLRTSWLRVPLGAQQRVATVSGDVFFMHGTTLLAWRRDTGAIGPVCELPKTSEFRVSADGTHAAVDTPPTVTVVRCSDGAIVGSVARAFDSGDSFELGIGGGWVLFTHDVPVLSGSGWMQYATVSLDGKTLSTGKASGDGASIYLAPDGGTVITKDDALSPPYRRVFASHTGRNEPLAIDPEGRRALTPYDLHDVDREATRVLPDGCEHEDFDQPQALHLSAQRALCFWSNGHLVTHDLASGGASAVKLKQPQGYHQIGAFSPGGAVLAAYKRFVKSSPLVVLVGNEVSTQSPPMGPDFKPDSLAALDDGTVLVASPGHLDVLSFGASRRLPLPDEMRAAEVVSSADGRVIVVRTAPSYRDSDPRGPVLVFVDEVEALTPGDTFPTAAWSVAVQRDGRRVAVSTLDGVSLWSVRPAQRVGELACGPAVALAFSADGRRLFASNPDTTLTVWELPPA